MRTLLILIFCLTIASPALAHKIRVFAYQEGTQIITETRFSGGRAARDATVTATANGQSINEGTSNIKGIYTFQIPHDLAENPQDITITTQTDDGHKAHWTLLAEDIHSIHDASAEPHAHVPQEAGVIQTPSKTQQNTAPPLTESAIRIIVQEELAKGLAPINRELTEKGPSLQDIFGGIGYIFGLLGIAAFFTSRKKQ